MNKRRYFQLGCMIFLTLATQLITLIKMSVIASTFGISVQMDAFNFSNNIATFIFSFISTGVATVLIPAYIYKKSPNAINSFVSVIYFFSIIAVIFIYISRYVIASLFSSDMVFITTVCSLMLIILISQFTNTIIGVASAYLQSKNVFNSPKVIVLIINLILTILVFLKKNISIYDYSLFILITSFISMTLHVILIKKYDFRYKVKFDLKDEEFRAMIHIFIPTVFSAGIYQITLLTDSLIATSLGEGQISLLNYSNSIMGMINMLLTTNLITFIYPKISKEIEKKDNDNKVFEFFPLFIFLMVFIVVCLITIGKEGISLLYERGEFNNKFTDVIYLCTIIYSISLPVNMVRELIYRALYAHGDTKMTFYNSVSASIINFVLSIVLACFLGIYGIILGTVCTSFISSSNIIFKYYKKYEIKNIKSFVFIDIFKILTAAALTIIVIFFIQNYITINYKVVYVIFYGVLTFSIYFILILVMKVKFFSVKL
ncbi:oligosaccharide flippase family protein [[Eubacterium] hominis]|uniref:murein biosynthesis integral membrane protein MurJ n=1 Tax=[Eubacterium] hominis TaxID=2764325 RepID=UPI0022E18916